MLFFINRSFCVQASGHKVDGFHPAFQGKRFFVILFECLQLTDGCELFSHPSLLSFRSWSLTPLWQSWRSSWRKSPSSLHKWVSKRRPEDASAGLQTLDSHVLSLFRNRRGIPQLRCGQGTAPRGRLRCVHHRPLFHLNDQLSW